MADQDMPDKIVSLDAFRLQKAEDEQYTLHIELICIKCHHRGIHVMPLKSDLKDVPCGGCECVGFLVSTGQDVIWQYREDLGLDLY